MFTNLKLKRTVQIVEARLSEASSEDPIRDLMFLAEHYHSRGELDKASAASRQMVSVAEGDSETKFEVTPLDVDLLLDKRRLERLRHKRWRPLLISALAAELLVLAAVMATNTPQSQEVLTNLRCAVCPWDSQAFMQRARLERGHLDWAAADSDCDRALKLQSGARPAYSLKAWIAWDRGDYRKALQMINLSDLHQCWNVDFKARILSKLGLYREEARMFAGTTASIGGDDSDAAVLSGQALARSGDYNAALAAFRSGTDRASNHFQRRNCQTLQSQFLLKLGMYDEAIKMANEALSETEQPDSTIVSRAYLFRAEAKLHLKDLSGAVEDINRSIASEQFCKRQYSVRALILSELGRSEDAQEALRAVYDFSNFDDL